MRLATARGPLSAARRGDAGTHAALSFALRHQVDEDVLEGRLVRASRRASVAAQVAGRRIEPGAVAAADVQGRAERRHHVDAGSALQHPRRDRQGPGPSPNRSQDAHWRRLRRRCPAPEVRRRRCRRSRGSARPRPCSASRRAPSCLRGPARGSRPRNPAAPSDRRRRSARRGGEAAGRAGCRRRARGAASSRPTIRRRVVRRGCRDRGGRIAACAAARGSTRP